MDKAAIELDQASMKPTRGPDGRLMPVLTLPGDTLETTPLMGVITSVSTVATIAVIARAFALCNGPVWPLLSVATGCLAGEMFSGCFHWATDNYGSLKTPVVGFACAAFQGHHLAPWTISHRTFTNNVYKIAAATLPLMLASLILLSPCAAACLAVTFYLQLVARNARPASKPRLLSALSSLCPVFCVCARSLPPSLAAVYSHAPARRCPLLSSPRAEEFHRWSHTPPPLLPTWKRKLQKAGIALPMAEHIAHHKPPFDKHYCILTGRINGLLDSEPVLFWRRLEAIVYRANGQEASCQLRRSNLLSHTPNRAASAHGLCRGVSILDECSRSHGRTRGLRRLRSARCPTASEDSGPRTGALDRRIRTHVLGYALASRAVGAWRTGWPERSSLHTALPHASHADARWLCRFSKIPLNTKYFV